MLTNRTKYALKALHHLATHRGQGLLRAADIAEAENIPFKFLEMIMLELRNHGLIRSQAGRGGGHELAREPEQISVLSIIRAIEGPAAPLPCVSRTAYVRCSDCPSEDACGARRLMAQVHEAALDVMEQVTLADSIAPKRTPSARAKAAVERTRRG
jgi:Rrf2 family protein